MNIATQLAYASGALMETLWLTAAIWVVLALGAGMAAKRTGVSVALVEIVVGIAAGNFLGIAPTSKAEWVTFLAGFGSILLTFMAGAEIEPGVLRKYLKESLLIGFVAFLLPFVGAMLFAHFVAGWTWPASEICGIALFDDFGSGRLRVLSDVEVIKYTHTQREPEAPRDSGSPLD